MIRAISYGVSKPVGFGATQDRLKVMPHNPGTFREPGHSDWGNGLVVGHGPDSLWGKRQPVPDELNISGQRKAAEPGQLVGDVIHMEPQTPYKTALWAKTKEPRMAPLPQKHYALHVQRSVDPYDSVSKREAVREMGRIASDRRIKSASFAGRQARTDISYQTQFQTLHSASSSKARVLRPSTAKATRATLCTADEDRWNMDHMDLQRQSDQDKWQRRLPTFPKEERFNEIVGAQSFNSTNRGLLSIAPNCTRYMPTDPAHKTISETTVPIMRKSVNGIWPGDDDGGTSNFISDTERMKVPATASVMGVGPQTYADGRYDELASQNDIKLGARMITDQMIERWSKRLW
eukprot:jgi/Tetstr1/459446/TSEL_004814.t1